MRHAGGQHRGGGGGRAGGSCGSLSILLVIPLLCLIQREREGERGMAQYLPLQAGRGVGSRHACHELVVVGGGGRRRAADLEVVDRPMFSRN